MSKFLILLVSVFIVSVNAFAKVEFPAIIGSGMVLQQNSEAGLWGTAKPAAKLTVVTSWDNKKYKASADAAGKWKLAVLTPKAGGPYHITFDDGEKTALDNILIGEVWVCSGQSNMAMKLQGGMNQPIDNLHDVLMEASNDQIRVFTVKTATAAQPAADLEGNWKVSTPEHALEFSALAIQYAQLLQKYLKVPVGMIVTSVGGTPIRAWMSESSLKEIPEIKVSLGEKLGTGNPTVLYNAMVAPLTSYSIRGFLWYQGENDRREPLIYERQMQAMVKGWRADWGKQDLPFYFVEIAPWLYPGQQEGSAAVLREQQFKASQSIPHAGMAVTLDIGSNQTIHPPNKTDVAKRLTYLALAKTYGVAALPFAGPAYKQMTVAGRKATLTFDNSQLGLYLKHKESRNFEIAGSDQVFYPATAKVNGKGLVVESEKVEKPVAVRYAFKNYVEGDLYNSFGLPAPSFRTDSWEIK